MTVKDSTVDGAEMVPFVHNPKQDCVTPRRKSYIPEDILLRDSYENECYYSVEEGMYGTFADNVGLLEPAGRYASPRAQGSCVAIEAFNR
jgi:hypothetical protein